MAVPIESLFDFLCTTSRIQVADAHLMDDFLAGIPKDSFRAFVEYHYVSCIIRCYDTVDRAFNEILLEVIRSPELFAIGLYITCHMGEGICQLDDLV